jgi:hypothetical protein
MGKTDITPTTRHHGLGCSRSLIGGPAEIPQRGPLVETEIFLQHA